MAPGPGVMETPFLVCPKSDRSGTSQEVGDIDWLRSEKVWGAYWGAQWPELQPTIWQGFRGSGLLSMHRHVVFVLSGSVTVIVTSPPIRTGKNIVGVVELQEDLVQGIFAGVDI